MKIRNRLLGSLSLIAVMSVVSLASASAATTSAASKKASSDGMQVGIFYSPSIINDKIDATAEAAGAEVKPIDLTGNTKFAWLGGGAKVGYKMGDVVISAVTDYRKTDYYASDDNKDLPFPVPTATATATDAGKIESFVDVSKWYTGIDVDYMIAISKEMSVAVGAGAGMEYNTMNIKYGTTDTTGAAISADAKLTALPFALQGNASFGYEVTPGITPYVGYTLRYAFETDLKPKDDAVTLNTNLGLKELKLKSSVDHIFKIGVNFAF
ncbi:hypothetical protein GUI12_02505 [Anaplasmataceae bacterium AB001_6]|nr:hypothetical protein GUI12_02505 [Anaplasmataceae bacterium AB001_6]